MKSQSSYRIILKIAVFLKKKLCKSKSNYLNALLANSAKTSDKSIPISTVKLSIKESVIFSNALLSPKTFLKNKTNYGINCSKSNPGNSNFNATPNKSTMNI
jgi:hypothetical protein